MKKPISMLLASAIAISSAIPVFAADTFTDVKTTGDYSWAYEYVENMADMGLISGYEDGSFRPANPVSRMDAFALFARIIGSNNAVNKATLEFAKAKYADALADYDLSYVEGDVAFMLSRGILSEDELDTYFAGKKKTEPMPRYEAAILITKAMLAEEEATSEVLLDMEYTDVAEIPKNARQYVYYVSQKGIMSGMGNGEFSPATPVRRSEIAVMMSKTIDSISYYFEETKLEGVDTSVNNIKISDFDTEIGYNDDTKFFINGEPTNEDAMKVGQNVVLTYNESDSGVHLTFVDITAPEIEETISGIFRGYSSSIGKVSISLEDPANGKTKSYECNPSVTVTVNNKSSDINKLKSGLYVTLGVADDMVVEVSSMQTTETISGAEIVDINPMGTITISHESAVYDGMSYAISEQSKIYKNGDNAEYSNLYRGDTVNLTLDYGILTKIVASSKKNTVSGNIESYTISSSPSLTIKTGGELRTYDIPSDVVITYNGETAKLADFEIGYPVKLEIESDVVKKITASSSEGAVSSSSIKGTVAAVSAKTKAILVTYVVGNEEISTHITCKDSTKYHLIPSFAECGLDDIEVGDTITAYGDTSTGFFVCTAVTVEKASK